MEKTENTRLQGHKNISIDVNQDDWRNTRKHGSYKCIQLACASLCIPRI